MSIRAVDDSFSYLALFLNAKSGKPQKNAPVEVFLSCNFDSPYLVLSHQRPLVRTVWPG